jgi:hypothetical protein
MRITILTTGLAALLAACGPSEHELRVRALSDSVRVMDSLAVLRLLDSLHPKAPPPDTPAPAPEPPKPVRKPRPAPAPDAAAQPPAEVPPAPEPAPAPPGGDGGGR